MIKRLMLLFCLAANAVLLLADIPDSTRITYKIPARVKVNSPFGVPETKTTPVNKTFFADSLQDAIIALSLKKDSLLSITQEEEARLQSMEAQMRQLSEENKNLGNELENANGDKLQSSHTNSILYIFNVILGIILLIALVWMIGKKKIREPEISSGNGYANNGSHEVYPTVPALDHRLERIEKLGNLRDKGLLTEEEFNLQKKQILAERT